MNSFGVVRAAKPWMRGFDCLSPVSALQAAAAKSSCYDFVSRYIEDLTPGEVQGLFAAGLPICLFTEGITSGPLTPAEGHTIALARAKQATLLGCPPGATIFTDHESPPAGSDSMGYLQQRALATIASGFIAGLYGGMPIDITGPQMYSLAFTRYARGGGAVPEPQCGFCWYQAPPLQQMMPWGALADVEFLMQDFKGRLPTLWYPQ